MAETSALKSSASGYTRGSGSDRIHRERRIWRSHYENAAPAMQTLAMDYPGDRNLNSTTSSLFRSLGQFETAAQIAERISRSDPRDRQTLAVTGEIYADREQFQKARSYWNRIADIEPGRAEGYLDAATIFWDYYQYDDALRVIERGRANLAQSGRLRLRSWSNL